MVSGSIKVPRSVCFKGSAEVSYRTFPDFIRVLLPLPKFYEASTQVSHTTSFKVSYKGELLSFPMLL